MIVNAGLRCQPLRKALVLDTQHIVDTVASIIHELHYKNAKSNDHFEKKTIASTDIPAEKK